MEKTLNILWTTGDPRTAQSMVLMYAKNSMLRQWWDHVNVIIWGASAKLVAEDETIQTEIELSKHAGVTFTSCIACAVQQGVVDKFNTLGIEMKPWGEPLTELIQSGQHLITV